MESCEAYELRSEKSLDSSESLRMLKLLVDDKWWWSSAVRMAFVKLAALVCEPGVVDDVNVPVRVRRLTPTSRLCLADAR